MDQYGRFAEDNQEEFQVMVDMISIFLDEKAIGELATGNAFFVLKDMVKKEVTYNSYEYDENYKSTLVEKTTTELLPEFLFMFSTSNEEMLTKIMGLGIKNEILIENNKYYTINSKKGDLPFDIFFVIKDGIVFISTDEIEIKTIVQGGKFENNLASRHQKLVSSNSQVIYINNQKITEYIPADFFSRRSQDEYAMYKEFGCEEIVVSSKNKNGNNYLPHLISTGTLFLQGKSVQYALIHRIGTQTLESYFKERGSKLPTRVILSIGVKLLRALKHFHKLGSVYNALALESVILSDVADNIDDLDFIESTQRQLTDFSMSSFFKYRAQAGQKSEHIYLSDIFVFQSNIQYASVEAMDF